MKRALKRFGKKTITVSELRENRNLRPDITGDISGNLYGDISDLYGNIDGNLSGNISNLYGNISDLSGNIGNLSGNIGNLYGNIGNLSGNIDGLYGRISNLSGNIDNCEITDTERENGINIDDLIAK